MLTKLLCSPYNKQEPWKMAVTLYNGTIYFSEIETEESRARTARETPREQQMCYWGMKFEDYMTSSGWLLISSLRYSTCLVDFWTGGTSSNTSYFRYLSFQRSMPQSCKRCTHCPWFQSLRHLARPLPRRTKPALWIPSGGSVLLWEQGWTPTPSSWPERWTATIMWVVVWVMWHDLC